MDLFILTKKAAFIDVDGTLTTDHNAWEKVHRRFGLEKEMKEHHALFFSQKITYDEWAKMDVTMWKGRPYSDFQDALKNPKLIGSAREGIQLLQRNGFEVVLISGGLEEMVKNVADMIQADSFISNVISQTDGIIDGQVMMKVGVSKEDVIADIAKNQNYDLEASIAIGDGFNDIEMFKSVGYSVSLNPTSEEVADAADSVYFSNNFYEVISAVLDFIP